jgi:hypothetical protein
MAIGIWDCRAYTDGYPAILILVGKLFSQSRWRAVQGIGLQPFDCWYRGFESR